LERKATEAEKKQGFDLADFLRKFESLSYLNPKAGRNTPAVQ
jgi:hypothetical protein